MPYPPNPRLLRDPDTATVPATSTPVRYWCCEHGRAAYPDPCPYQARHQRTAREGTAAVAVALLAASGAVPWQRSPEHDQQPVRRPLSPRERDVVSGWASGLRSHEIARDLGIRTDSVNRAGTNARLSLGARTQAHAVYLAIKAGEIDQPAPATTTR